MSEIDEAVEAVCDKVRKLRSELEIEQLKVRCFSFCLALSIIGLVVLAFFAR